jgi:hypothetical protein
VDIPEFAYLGSAPYRHIAYSLCRELFDTLLNSDKSLSVGNIIDIRPGLWLLVCGLLEHQDLWESHFGTLVLQLHSKNSPNPEQNDPLNRNDHNFVPWNACSPANRYFLEGRSTTL